MKMEKYAHGTFNWIDLATHDLDKAKAFYSELFGWSSQDNDTDQGVYTMFFKGDLPVAAAYAMQPEQREGGMPSHWMNYISVDALEPVVARIKAAGGQVYMETCEVMEHGRMAAVADPTGAGFCLWQPKAHIGAGLVNEPGAFCWNELMTTDQGKATDFYREVFGWTVESMPMGETGQVYNSVKNNGNPNGGIIAIDPAWGEMPSCWVPYITVEDCKVSFERAVAMGATVPLRRLRRGAGRERPGGASRRAQRQRHDRARSERPRQPRRRRGAGVALWALLSRAGSC